MRLLISRKTRISYFPIFFIFMMKNYLFFKIFRKIRKNNSISPVAWNSGKTKLLSRYFRLKSWKSVNSSIFIKFIHFHYFTIFSEKVDFLDFFSTIRNFHPWVKKRRHQVKKTASGGKWMEMSSF